MINRLKKSLFVSKMTNAEQEAEEKSWIGNKADIKKTAGDAQSKLEDTANLAADQLSEQATWQRRRTVVMSIVASSLVAVFLGHAFDVESSNSQAVRSRVNCIATQNLAEKLTKVATQVSNESPVQAVQQRWTGFANDFAQSTVPNTPSCKDQFPTRKRFLIVK